VIKSICDVSETIITMASATVPPHVNPFPPLLRKDLTTHPYKANNLVLEFNDTCKRPLFRLIASLKFFGRMLTDTRNAAHYSNETPPANYHMYLRLFNDNLTNDDFRLLIDNLDHTTSNEAAIIDGRDLPQLNAINTTTIHNFKAYRRTIIYLHVPPDKSSIFVVTPSITKQRVTITVNAYFKARDCSTYMFWKVM
jgi:hypothetical protein